MTRNFLIDFVALVALGSAGYAYGSATDRKVADCSGCSPGRAYERPDCNYEWTLPDGSKLCLDGAKDRFKQLYPECPLPRSTDEE